VAGPSASLARSLSRVMAQAGSSSGAYVVDMQTGKRLFTSRGDSSRVLASNTKLFTTGAALARSGPGATIPTRAMIAGPLDAAGTLDGNVYLRGGGDPAFGSKSFVAHHYGGGATIEQLADLLVKDGLRVVTGRVVGDESRFDSRRGGPYSGFAASGEVGGPISALAYNHGLGSGGHFQTNPPSYVAGRLTDALRSRGVDVRKSAKAGRTPSGSIELARVNSPSMAKLAKLTDVPSDNWFAEELAKGLPGAGGSTTGGARAAQKFARSRGARAHLVDGSGLSQSNKASPHSIVTFLVNERSEPEGNALFAALPVAGESGTLSNRMTSGPAHRNCHAKTGTLRRVSALSGYCRSKGGHVLAFSILMNGQSSISRAHVMQDRMARSIASYQG